MEKEELRLLFLCADCSFLRQVECDKELAFQDGMTTSFSGRSEQDIKRNTPTLINVAQSPTYLWDNSVEGLEHQFIHVFKAQDEFNITFLEMEERLMAKPEYKEAFAQIFPTGMSVGGRNWILERGLRSSFFVRLIGLDGF